MNNQNKYKLINQFTSKQSQFARKKSDLFVRSTDSDEIVAINVFILNGKLVCLFIQIHQNSHTL